MIVFVIFSAVGADVEVNANFAKKVLHISAKVFETLAADEVRQGV